MKIHFVPPCLVPACLISPCVVLVCLATSAFGGPMENRAACEGQQADAPSSLREQACNAVLSEQSLSSKDAATTLVHRAWARVSAGRRAEAMADYNRAASLAPDSYIVLNERALLHLREGKLDAALIDYQSALKLKPGEPYPLYGRGLVYLRQGDRPRGEADLKLARSANPRIDETFRKIGFDAAKF